MRSQIIQLSILVLLALTQSSVARKRCFEVPEITKLVTSPSTTTTTTTTSTTTTTIPTTTTTTTTTAAPDYCGKVKLYDVLNKPNDPEELGFPSGTYYDGSTIYPGTGDFNKGCNNQGPGAARIMSSNGVKGPGAYYSCSGGEKFENKNATFYLKHPNLKWVQTTGLLAAKVPGAVKVVSPYGTGYVGRINVTLKNGTFVQIGKILDNKLFYTSDNIKSFTSSNKDAIDVLACQP